ncbi:MAG: thioredoxin family protein [Pseudomonadota bacterium]|nr:thioredoxin family protein [Pseudomonadota bacterium]
MARTLSTMLNLGVSAPGFTLPNTNPNVGGETVSLDDFKGARALLVVFMCNHCPYVIHIRDAFAGFAREYKVKGLEVVAISANDVATHPDDRPELMATDAEKYGYSFPYLYDESQSVAQAYQAACTPDFFLFDGDRKLYYRGQFDDARPRNDEPVNGKDMRAAVDALLAGAPAPSEQKPSMGCNIKWKAGQEPDYSG